MAILSNALVQALFTGWKGDFQGALGAAPSQYSQIATVIQSTTKSNTYGWLGQVPYLREWIGDRVIKDVAEHGYQIVNKPFESTVGVNVDDIEDDNVGIYSPLFSMLGEEAGKQPDQLVFGALSDGFSKTCYDGQNFFDTDHPVYPNSDGTGEAQSVSNVFVDADYKGEPWYILDCTRTIKPIIFQNRKSPTLIAMDAQTDEALFTKKLLRYGVDTRCQAGYSFWQFAYAVKAPLTPDNLWKVYSAMRSFRGDGDKRLAIKPSHLVVPASLEKEATKILERELNTDGTNVASNELKGKLQLIVGDYL